ncbi:hypothetical protein CDD82_2766 [Ophiocordyceps australis]|uniref:Uncharacterized protein n=1 Tax=Ophiocordyceps australis TaxID=1399860 RepID=A0A2C5ZHJ8_9HYPO|nr:hypothetical protein CDD82_2766 [Ophiocordyceps australis]
MKLPRLAALLTWLCCLMVATEAQLPKIFDKYQLWENSDTMWPMERSQRVKLRYRCAGDRFGEDYRVHVNFWRNGTVSLDCDSAYYCPDRDFSHMVGRICTLWAGHKHWHYGFDDGVCHFLTFEMRDRWPRQTGIIVKAASNAEGKLIGFTNGKGNTVGVRHLKGQNVRITGLEPCP